MVIDSQGVIYALSNHELTVKLTAISSEGKVLWQKHLTGESGLGLYLYNDTYLIVAESYGGLGTGIGVSSDRKKIKYMSPGTILSKYNTAGSLVWENQYPNVDMLFTSKDIAVDGDGYIAFSGLYGYIEGTPRTIYEDITVRNELQLIGVTPEGVTSLRKTLLSSTEANDSFISSAPTIVNSNIYLSASKGYLEDGASIYTKANFMKFDKSGKKLLSTEIKGTLNKVSPIFLNNQFYVSTMDSLYIINTSGKVLKTISSQNENYFMYPSISTSGHIIFAESLYDPSGKRIWNLAPKNQNTVVIDSLQSMIFPFTESTEVGAEVENVASINLLTQKTNWMLSVNHEILIPAVIGKDGTVYVAGTELTAIGQE